MPAISSSSVATSPQYLTIESESSMRNAVSKYFRYVRAYLAFVRPSRVVFWSYLSSWHIDVGLFGGLEGIVDSSGYGSILAKNREVVSMSLRSLAFGGYMLTMAGCFEVLLN